MRFRLWTLFLLTTLAAIAFAAPSIYRNFQFRRLVSYANVDLKSLDESEAEHVSELFAKLASPIPEQVLPYPSRIPWYVWPVGKGRFMYLRGSPCYRIPGISAVHFHLFDSSGNVTFATEFSTGYRITILDASISESPSGHYIISIESAPVINGRDVAKQWLDSVFDERQ